jgi:hypothetical protein
VSPDPVSWFLIERGWDVVGSDGKELGTVHEVLGDTTADIFDGFIVFPGLLKNMKYIPSERVQRIVEGRIDVDLTSKEFARLGDYDERAPGAAKTRR